VGIAIMDDEGLVVSHRHGNVRCERVPLDGLTCCITGPVVIKSVSPTALTRGC
jgi:hypothetical protein